MNTTITIKYSNGSIREFVASDKLEEIINEGEMFSVTTMHSDMGIDEEMSVSKMYAGNPVAALGHMMMMKRNAEGLLKEDEQMNIVIETCNACITFLSNEITSHQSGMSPVTGSSDVLPSTLCKHFHIDKNWCLHLNNLDNPCIGYSNCDDYKYVNDIDYQQTEGRMFRAELSNPIIVELRDEKCKRYLQDLADTNTKIDNLPECPPATPPCPATNGVVCQSCFDSLAVMQNDNGDYLCSDCDSNAEGDD